MSDEGATTRLELYRMQRESVKATQRERSAGLALTATVTASLIGVLMSSDASLDGSRAFGLIAAIQVLILAASTHSRRLSIAIAIDAGYTKTFVEADDLAGELRLEKLREKMAESSLVYRALRIQPFKASSWLGVIFGALNSLPVYLWFAVPADQPSALTVVVMSLATIGWWVAADLVFWWAPGWRAPQLWQAIRDEGEPAGKAAAPASPAVPDQTRAELSGDVGAAGR